MYEVLMAGGDETLIGRKLKHLPTVYDYCHSYSAVAFSIELSFLSKSWRSAHLSCDWVASGSQSAHPTSCRVCGSFQRRNRLGNQTFSPIISFMFCKLILHGQYKPLTSWVNWDANL